MAKKWIGLLILLALISVPALADEKILRFDDQNFQIQVPVNWQAAADGSCTLTRPDGGTLMITSVPTKLKAIDQSFKDLVSKTLASQGVELLKGIDTPFLNFNGYAISVRTTSSGQVTWEYQVSFVAGGRLYNVGILKLNEDPQNDQELLTMMNNFSFISPPSPTP